MPNCRFNIKKITFFFFLLTFIPSIFAHEFWLCPAKFIYKRTDKINIRFLAGKNFEGENWGDNNGNIRSLKIYFGGVIDDLSPVVTESTGDSIEYTMIDEGTNLIAFHSTNSYKETNATEFEEYLERNGLINVIDYRNEHNENGCHGREFYQRCAKTLIQVGNVKDQTFKIPTFLPIDIIPLSNPYSAKDNDLLRVKVFYKSSPLVGGLVKVWHRLNEKTGKKDFFTDANGEIAFKMPTRGKWMISTVKMERLTDNPICDWQSYGGSLTWGYE